MALTDQQVCAYMKNELKRNPLGVLSQYKLTVGLADGYQTQIQNLHFSAKEDPLRPGVKNMGIGPQVFCNIIPGNVNIVNLAPVRCVASPM